LEGKLYTPTPGYAGSTWIKDAAEVMFGNLVRLVRIDEWKSVARFGAKYELNLYPHPPEWRMIRAKIYTNKPEYVAGRLWRIRKNLCRYEECDEPVAACE